MSIKLTVISKKDFKNGNTDNKYHIKMKGSGVNHILVNTLRRVCLDLIPIHAFNPDDIQIKKNSSVYNNDIIRLRLSTFPIYNIKNNVELVDDINKIQNRTLEEDSLEKLQIFFSKKNHEKELEQVAVKAAMRWLFLQRDFTVLMKCLKTVNIYNFIFGLLSFFKLKSSNF